jgi:hypothetical protein
MSQLVNAAPARESLSKKICQEHRPQTGIVFRTNGWVSHHFSIAGHEGYLTVGLYPNGQPGESLHPDGADGLPDTPGAARKLLTEEVQRRTNRSSFTKSDESTHCEQSWRN